MFDESAILVAKWNETDNPYIQCVKYFHAKFLSERQRNRKLRVVRLKIKKFCEENPDVIPLLASEAISDVDYYTAKLDPDSKDSSGQARGLASMYYCGRYTQDHVLACLQRLFHDLATPITYFGRRSSWNTPFIDPRDRDRPAPRPIVMDKTETSGAIRALTPKFLGDIHPMEEFNRVAESLRVNHNGYALKFFANNAPALLREAMEWKIPQDPDDIEPVTFDSTPVLITK